jgi:hypothetical protein
VLLLVSLTEERAIYLPLELDRSWTEMPGVNPLDGTNYLDTVSAFIEAFLHLLIVTLTTVTVSRDIHSCCRCGNLENLVC